MGRNGLILGIFKAFLSQTPFRCLGFWDDYFLGKA